MIAKIHLFPRCLHRPVLSALLLVAGSLGAATYHVDPAGKDANDGLSPQTAWQSLAQVNRRTFVAGDKILFKAGGVWTGQLNPRGNGDKHASILLSCYGAGAKPVINGGGQAEGAIKLLNQEYWEIRNFEVTNRGPLQNQHVGIKVRNSTGGPLRRIVIADCVVHDINGYPSGFYGANAGISVVADINNSIWADILIENNQVYAVDRVGIFVGPTWQVGTSADWMKEPKSEDIVIRNNAVWDLGGDGIINFITRNVLIEYNIVHDSGRRGYDEAVGPKKNPTGYLGGASAGIWNVISDHTVMQFNEVYNFLNPHDGQAFDIDMGTNHTFVQYNYSHDNAGGFLLVGESAGLAKSNDAWVRFNLSQNDGPTKGVIHIGGHGGISGPDKLQFHNNTILVPASATPGIRIIQEYRPRLIAGAAFFYNNIFYSQAPVSYPESLGEFVFDHNVFFGSHPAGEPADAHKLTDDPRLQQPGSGGKGLASVDGYKLLAGSPALDSGRNNGRLGSRDYWGNSVSPTDAVNRGAYNGPGVAPAGPNWALNAKVTASSALDAPGWSPARLVDGRRTSSEGSRGFSTAPGHPAGQPAWVEIDLGGFYAVGRVVLYPTTVDGQAGRGFPRDFEIQTWNGSAWQTRSTQTDYANPGATPQAFVITPTLPVDRLRVHCTGLAEGDAGGVLQLAEIEVLP